MKFLFLFTFLALSISLKSYALTAHKEIKSMSEVISDIHQVVGRQGHSPKKVLVVFDIDNTVLANREYLGSDQWFNWKANQIKQGNPKAFPVLLQWQGILFSHAPMRLTEVGLDKSISYLQKVIGLPVIALTSRSPSFRAATERELIKNGVNFSQTSIGLAIGGSVIPKGFKRLVSYSNGIFMTSGQHKGQMLSRLVRSFNKGAFPYTQVIFVDDHKKNTTRVFDTLKQEGVEILSYRYGKEDVNVATFNGNNGIKSYMTKQLKALRATLISIFKTAPPMI